MPHISPPPGNSGTGAPSSCLSSRGGCGIERPGRWPEQVLHPVDLAGWPTRDLIDEFATAFNEADVLFITPIYAAGEPEIAGLSADRLIEKIRGFGHRDVRSTSSVDAVIEELAAEARPNDLIVAFGAGDIGKTGKALVKALEEKK